MSDRPPGPTAGRLAAWLTLIGVVAALNYASRFLAEDATDTGSPDFFYRWDTFVGGVVQFGVMTAILLWIVHGGPAATLLALTRPRSWGTAAGMMLVVFVGVLIVGALVSPFFDAGDEQGLVPEEWQPENAAPFAANVAVTTMLVPIVEELTFRGAGVSLLSRYGTTFAIVGTGILFGLAHGLVLALPILVAFGVGLAWLRVRSGSVYPGIVLHGLFNAVSVFYGVFG